MMFCYGFVQFADIEQFCKVVKMEHRFIFAVLAKESYLLTEIHIFEVIGDEAAVTALDTFAEGF